MGDMGELVTVEQAERVIGVLVYALPVAGAVLAAAIGAVRRLVGPAVRAGLIVGLCGPAIWGLWRMHNGIIGVYGLDSVRGLLIELGVFVGIGLAVGVTVGVIGRRAGRASRERRDSSLRSE